MSLDKQARIKITASAELGELQKLNDSISKMGDGFMKATVGATSLGTALANVVGSIGGKLANTLQDAAQKLVKFIEAGDDFNDTVGANRDSVWKMAEATQHLGSAMDVARLRSRLMASEGLKPTEEQLISLTRAATHLANKQKTEWSEAADKIANTWQGMGARGLKPLNIEIDQNLSLMDRQRQILTGVQSLGELNLSQAQKEKALIKEKDDAYLHLSATMNDNAAIAAAMNFSQVTRLQNEIKWVQSLEEGWRRVWFAIQGPSKSGKPRAGSSSAHARTRAAYMGEEDLESLRSYEQGYGGGYMAGVYATDDFGTGSASEGASPFYAANRGWGKEAVGGKATIRKGGQEYEIDTAYSQGAALTTYKKPTKGHKKKKHPWWDHYLEQMARELEEEAEYVMDQEARGLKRRMAEGRRGREDALGAEGESQRLRLGAEFKDWTAGVGRKKKAGDLSGTFAGKLFGSDVAEGATQNARALAEYEQNVNSLNATLNDFTVGSLANFAGGLWAAADAAIQGGEGMAQAMMQMVKSTLLGIASQSTIKAIFEYAEGTAAAARFAASMGLAAHEAVASATHFASATMYATIAGGTGIAGLAVSGMQAATKSSGGSAGARSSGGAAGGDFRPSFGSKQSSKDLPPIIVRVTFDRSDPAAEQFARRQVRAQLLRAGGYGAD